MRRKPEKHWSTSAHSERSRLLHMAMTCEECSQGRRVGRTQCNAPLRIRAQSQEWRKNSNSEELLVRKTNPRSDVFRNSMPRADDSSGEAKRLCRCAAVAYRSEATSGGRGRSSRRRSECMIADCWMDGCVWWWCGVYAEVDVCVHASAARGESTVNKARITTIRSGPEWKDHRRRREWAERGVSPAGRPAKVYDETEVRPRTRSKNDIPHCSRTAAAHRGRSSSKLTSTDMCAREAASWSNRQLSLTIG